MQYITVTQQPAPSAQLDNDYPVSGMLRTILKILSLEARTMRLLLSSG
jgi:hypothetical protein